MSGRVIQRNSDVFGVVALVLVLLSAAAFVVNFFAVRAPAAEVAALLVFLLAVSTGLVVLVGGSRGRGAGIAAVVAAAFLGLVILSLVVLRAAYAAEGTA